MSESQITPELPAPLRVFDTILEWLAAICRLITGFSLVFLTVIFGWLVFGRYVLNSTPTWVEQAALLLVMAIAFLGAAVGVREGTHLAVLTFRDLSPRWLRSAFVVITDVLLAGFGALMLRYGWELTVFKWGSMIPLIDLPEGLRSLPLTVGGGLILLFTLGHMLRFAFGCDTRSSDIQ